MQMRRATQTSIIAISAMGCCLFVLVQVAAAGPSNDACDLPNELAAQSCK